MPGESPLSMMRPSRQRLSKPAAAQPVGSRTKPAAASPQRRLLWRVLVPAAIVVALVPGWVFGWYYSAGVANRTLAGWIDREAAAGRVYSCGSQDVGGFPLRIEVRCTDAQAQVNSYHPPFAVKAKDVTFTARVYRPTLLVGDVAGPLSLFEANESSRLVADWSRAQVSVGGLPPDPDRLSFTLDRPHLDRMAGTGATADAGGELLFKAEHLELHGRVVAGSPRNNPVIEAELRLTAATAPALHPLAAEPITAEADAVLSGFTDLSPKSLAAHFREMQAAGGSIEVKQLRITRSDAMVVGMGTLNVNPHGKLDGVIRIAIVGIERIVPLLGIDQIIGRGVDRIARIDNASSQGLAALDRLVPGLGGALRDTANASVIENLKKMGERTEVDHKPAIVLPLRFTDGAIYLGMVPLGDAPALFDLQR
jgi:hypothetical protein